MSEAKTVTVERSRYGYKVTRPGEPQQFLRRVTTFCGGIPKDALPPWAAKCVAEFAVEHQDRWTGLPKTDAVKLLKGVPWSKRDDAGDRGTAIHKTIEALVRGESIPSDLQTEDELECAIAVEEFLNAEPWKPLGSEVTVFSPKHGYAGTFDLLAKDSDGVTWILDWKSSSGIYPNMAVQQAAYLYAEYAVARKKPAGSPDEEKWVGQLVDWGPHRADRLGIVHVRPDGATLYPIRPEMVKRLWVTFRAAANVKMFLLDTDSSFGKTPREPVYEEPALEVFTKGPTAQTA